MKTSLNDARTDIEAAKTDMLEHRSAEQHRSPARLDQGRVPFEDAIERFHTKEMLPFAIPYHMEGKGLRPEFVRWAGIGAARADAPLSHGIDRRDHSWKVLETAQQLFADAVGADSTTFVTNGSSMSVRVALMTVAGPGDTLLVARNSHKSAVAGLVLGGIRPAWLDPTWSTDLEVAHPPTAEEVERVLELCPEAKGVFVTSPDFYGGAADVARIAALCHDRDIPLIIDDAWGVDYLFGGHTHIPESPLKLGADLVIGSIHKSMTGLSQSSVIHVQGARIDTDRLSLVMELEKSTSTSTLLLSGIDGARAQYVRDGKQLVARAVDLATYLREQLTERVPELHVVGVNDIERSRGVLVADPTHVCIEVHPIGLTGYQASDWLQDHESITFELMDHRRIMACVAAVQDEVHIDRLVRGLRALVDAHHSSARGDDGANRFGPNTMPHAGELRAEQVMLPRDAFFAGVEQVDWPEAVGRIAADMVTPYPPGVPVLAPGERITEPIMEYLQRVVAAGCYCEGTTDPTLATFRVVRA